MDSTELTIDEIRSQQQQLDRARKELAEQKRAQITEHLAQVSMLTAEADELDPPPPPAVPEKPKPVRKIKADATLPRPTSTAIPTIRTPAGLGLDGVIEEPKPSLKPRRTRKPKAEKPTKPATEKRVTSKGELPTEKTVLGALKALGEPSSIGAIAEQLGCDKSLLTPVLVAMVDAKTLKKTGEKRGTKYQVK